MRRLCEGLPVVSGLVKTSPEDFEVEEVPAYLPSGRGDHLYLWVEKRGLNTQEVVRELAALAGVRASDVGVAGQKDRQAVTRQWVSVPAGKLTEDDAPEGEGWRVLAARRHGNKLRTGHLRGNRFRIRVRGGAGDVEAARACLARLAEQGVPNYYGAQRFGRWGDNAEKGLELLAGRLKVKDRFRRRLLVSAFQSQLFNDWLDRRIDGGTFARPLLGDVLQVRASGGLFVCRDPAAEADRVRAGDLDPAGPIFGPKMKPAEDDALALEAEVLAAAGIDAALFEAGGRLAQGARRAGRVSCGSPTAEAVGDDLDLVFDLPSGSYATVVLAELMG